MKTYLIVLEDVHDEAGETIVVATPIVVQAEWMEGAKSVGREIASILGVDLGQVVELSEPVAPEDFKGESE